MVYCYNLQWQSDGGNMIKFLIFYGFIFYGIYLLGRKYPVENKFPNSPLEGPNVPRPSNPPKGQGVKK